MNEIADGQPTLNVVVVQPAAPDPKAQRNWKRFLRTSELVAVLFWSYALTKLFVFDIDVYLVTLAAPGFMWLLSYKLLIILGLLLLAMMVTRSGRLAFAVAYIALYPLIIAFWKIPKFVWKQKSWLLAFAILNSLIGFYRTFKRKFILPSRRSRLFGTSNNAVCNAAVAIRSVAQASPRATALFFSSAFISLSITDHLSILRFRIFYTLCRKREKASQQARILGRPPKVIALSRDETMCLRSLALDNVALDNVARDDRAIDDAAIGRSLHERVLFFARNRYLNVRVLSARLKSACAERKLGLSLMPTASSGSFDSRRVLRLGISNERLRPKSENMVYGVVGRCTARPA
jgi:hypothetical protein